MNDNQKNFSDILNLASLIVGIQNLQENREQSAHNDIQAENQRQAEYLLQEIRREFGEIRRQFSKQNEMLRRISEALKNEEERESGKVE